MFIKKITIQNYRLFSPVQPFEIDDFGVPDGVNPGSGLTVFVGENGSGKSSILEALALPILEYKSDSFRAEDINDLNCPVQISLYANTPFEVAKSMPKGSFQSKGFSFEAKTRSKGSKSYLASVVVSDQRFIKVDPNDPKDGSPDLRVSVNNPFKGKRFNENDFLALDRNRLYQTRSGNFNTTRFDRLMDDFNFQYLNGLDGDPPNLNIDLDDKVKRTVSNSFLVSAIKKFTEFSGAEIKLNFLSNTRPFSGAFFAETKENNQQIALERLGSGYEMMFALLYSFHLSRQGKKQLIALIDEPELHLHPRLQGTFIEFLLDLSRDVQVVIASHSPLLVKQLFDNNHSKIRVLRKDSNQAAEVDERALSYTSANEINYVAFDLATEEYHNELYEYLKAQYGQSKTYKSFDNDYFVSQRGEPKCSPWKGSQNEVSVHTFIRNQIHHRAENGKASYQFIKSSIDTMRGFILSP